MATLIERPTYYDTLHILPNADQAVVGAAYKALAKIHHPDKGGDVDHFNKIGEAHSLLKNKKKRKKYNEQLQEEAAKAIGNYRVLEQLSEGGFGRVYLAEHKDTGAKACIKHSRNISPEDTQLLIKEVNAIWDLRHHALPAARDFYQLEDGSCALVMSYIPGPTLEELVSDKKLKLDPEDIAWISHRMLDSLRYVHYHGVVHGDVKPQNIIVQPETHTCALVDYGLASVNPNRNAKALGYTPVFAPPEALRGGPLLPESDLYSLGLTMIYAFGGDPLAKKIPSKVPDPICDFIGRLLVYDVLGRPNWEQEDLVHTFTQVRLDSFGRAQTNMKKIKKV